METEVPSGECLTLAELANALIIAKIAARSPIGRNKPESRYGMGDILVGLVWRAIEGALMAYAPDEARAARDEIRAVIDPVLAGRVPAKGAVEALRERG